MEAGTIRQAGLVGTNSSRGGDNRKVLEHILHTGVIFEAWSDEPWVVEGAAVHVSLICFGRKKDEIPHLDGKPVVEIFSDLTARGSQQNSDLTKASQLPENAHKSFMGVTKTGPFDIDGELARSWLSLPLNPNGRPNTDVLKKSVNGEEITGRSSDRWIIDFGVGKTEAEIALYEAPFSYAYHTVI
jgi:type II restriction/modification system DNA methylase subunit YeeA